MGIDLAKIQSRKYAAPRSGKRTKGSLDFLNKDIRLFGNGFSDKKKERFYSELSMLFAAGVDIRSALELIESEQKKEAGKQLFATIKDAIISGSGFSKALEQTAMFSNYEIYSLQIGEESGKLSDILQELALFFSRKIRLKRQLTGALSYPLVVLAVSAGAIIFMIRFVVPMFADVFKRLKGELPYFTKLILRFSELFTQYSLPLFLGLAALITLVYIQRKALWFRKGSAALLLRMPVLKDLIGKIYLARFCQSMNLLINAKTPLVTALGLVQKMIGFYPIEIALETVKTDIEKGMSLHQSLSKFRIFNQRLTSLIKVAEEVNQLDTMFSRLTKQYSDEVEHQTGILGSLIEPLMIIFLGVMIAFIMLAMYLPMFQMSNSIG